MKLPPEVLFHRHFTNLANPNDRRLYRGKADLDRLKDCTLPVSLLRDLQDMMNLALLHDNKEIPEHVDHDAFHFDYVDSDEANALAFCVEGYSFIGVTIPLLDLLWNIATRLSVADHVAAFLGIDEASVEESGMTIQQRIQVAIFRLELFFITLHEYTHVVHGHTPRKGPRADADFANELPVSGTGSLLRQVREADADGYAVYFMLAALIDGAERAHILSVLGVGDRLPSAQDEILLSCFVMGVAGYFFVTEPQVLTRDNVYTFSHPPQAARLALLMQSVRNWCRQNRLLLVTWMTPTRFQEVLRRVAAATWGMNGGDSWSDQFAFFESKVGKEYFQELSEGLTKHIQLGYH